MGSWKLFRAFLSQVEEEEHGQEGHSMWRRFIFNLLLVAAAAAHQT